MIYTLPFPLPSSPPSSSLPPFPSPSPPRQPPPHSPFSNISVSSVQFIRSVMSNSLRPHELKHSSPLCPSPIPGVYPNSCPSSRWCHAAISSSVIPFSACFNPSQNQDLFQWVNSSHEVAEVFEFQLQHQFFQWKVRTDLLQNGLVGSPCSLRDSQESSPTPQFKSINFR